MKKKKFPSLIFFFSFFFFLSYLTAPLLAKTVFRQFLKKCDEISFDCSSFYWKGFSIQIKNGLLSKKGEFNLAFQDLCIDPFKLFKKKLSFSIEAPLLEISEGANARFPQYLKQWRVEKIELIRGTLTGNRNQKLKIEVSGSCGNFIFAFKDEEHEGLLNGKTSFQNEEFTLQAKSTHLNICCLTPFLNLAIDEKWLFKIQEAIATGEIEAKWSLKKDFSYESNFIFDQLVLAEPRTQMILKIDQASGCLGTNICKKEGTFQLKAAKVFIPLLKEPICCQNVYLTTKNNQFELVPTEFSWKAIRGLLQTDDSSRLQVSCSGSCLELCSLFSSPIEKAFREKFKNDFFSLKVESVSLLKDFGFLGEFSVGNQKVQSIFFGYNTKDLSEELMQLKNLPCYLEKGLKEEFQSPFSRGAKGWISANFLPLNKYFSPFVFHSSSIEVEGDVSVTGLFDQNHLFLNYSLDKAAFLGNKAFELQVDQSELDICPGMKGVHFFQLQDFSHKGILNLGQAAYFHRNCDLLFENGEGIVFFKDDKIFLKSGNAACNDILFAGDLELTLSKELELKIVTHSIEAKLESARKFLKQILPFDIWDTPLNGNLKSYPKGVDLVFKFTPKAHVVSGSIYGHADASWNHPLFHSVEGGFDFHYSFEDEKLKFTHLAGECSLVKNFKEHYQFHAHELSFKDFSDLQFDCLMNVSKASGIPFQIFGKCEKNGAGEKRISIHSPDFSLDGFFLGKEITIEAYQFGQLKGDAKLSICNKKICIYELTTQIKERLEGWAKGEFDIANFHLKIWEGFLSGHIKKVAQLQHCPNNLKKWIFNSHLTGHFDGSITGEYNFLSKDWSVEGEGLFQAVQCAEIPLALERPLKVKGSSLAGWSLKDVKGHLEDLRDCSAFTISEIRFDRKVEIERLCFSLSPFHKKQIKSCLYHLSGHAIDPRIAEVIYSLKKEERIDGELSLAQDEGGYVEFKVNEGRYTLSDGSSFQLKAIEGKWDLSGLSLFLESGWKTLPVHACLKFNSGRLNEGALQIFSDLDPEEIGLTVIWQYHHRKLSISSIEGVFTGLEMRLKEVREEKETMVFEGSIGLNARAASHLLPENWKEIVNKLDVGKGFFFEGALRLPKSNLKAFELIGNGFGREIEVGGIIFESFFSEIFLTAENCLIKSLRVTDPAGHLWIPLVDLRKTNDQKWKLMIPKIAFSNLRIGRLQAKSISEAKRKSYLKTLYIPSFEIDAISGCVGAPETFQAKAELKFANLTPRNFLSKLLSIPAEITARIGLDPSLLIPAEGTIHSEVSGGKIHLTCLEEVFSEGKRSKFYIPKQKSAYIDFEGNINLNVKMKQYNLLMKIAEFFTIGIRGTLLKPSYSLGSHDEEEVVADLYR